MNGVGWELFKFFLSLINNGADVCIRHNESGVTTVDIIDCPIDCIEPLIGYHYGYKQRYKDGVE